MNDNESERHDDKVINQWTTIYRNIMLDVEHLK